MVHRTRVTAILSAALAVAIVAVESHAQAPALVRVVASAGPATGQVHGLVRDLAGTAISGASIHALGVTIVSARSDDAGRFQMSLPVGDYVLRAARDGYVSTYREPVRVLPASRLERTITLSRQEDGVATIPDAHAHTTLAWLLRHLPRSVLRDRGQAAPAADQAIGDGTVSSLPEITGQVNLIATASTALSALTTTRMSPRSVAYIAVGAPLGSSGDLSVRGAIASGADSSWNLFGEYTSRDSGTHALGFGASFSSQEAQLPAGRRLSFRTVERNVVAVFAHDRWRPVSGVELAYAVRADRYDYLARPQLFSGTAELRYRAPAKVTLIAGVGHTMVAPGTGEYLPPSTMEPWLPPERTFSSLNPFESMEAETVRHAEVGLSRELGARAAYVRGFVQQTDSQLATIFGLRRRVGPGHYHVARVGAVQLTGWALGLDGRLFGPFTGRLEYARLAAEWQSTDRTRGLRFLAPSVARGDVEWLHDFTASVEGAFNDNATRVSLVYRAGNAFSDEARTAASRGGRFDVAVHQALPYHVTRSSSLELIFAARTLYHDARPGASLYDELLTVGPPLRLMGGIQVRF